MDLRLRRSVGAACALAGLLGMAAHARGQALPDGKGKAEFVHNCTACHLAGMVTAAKKTPDGWRKSVDEMAARGTDGTKEDLDNVVLYLVTNYGLPPGAAAAPAAAAAVPAAKPAPLTAAEMETVNGLIAENGCLICHRIERQGAYAAPSLNGVGARRTAEQIREAIVHPHATVAAENRLVRIITPDGKTMDARIVSQDDHTVRVMDAAGVVSTYAKVDLRQFTMIDANPMPSYEKRIAPEDMDTLVRYLQALPVVDDGAK